MGQGTSFDVSCIRLTGELIDQFEMLYRNLLIFLINILLNNY